MNKELLKNIGIYAAIAAFFIIISYGFMPEVLKGKIVNQSDIAGWRGMAEESVMWNKANPDNQTAWTDSMFGGMPNVTFVDNFKGDWTKGLYDALLWGRRPASYIFLALLGAFLMMLAAGVNRYLAVIGAVAVAFCSYNFQIIQVGHNTKMQAIAFAPWAIAALIYTYRSAFGKKMLRALWGAVGFAFALSFQVKANHVQITYYLAIVIFIYAFVCLVWVLLKRNRGNFRNFVIASVLLLVFGVIGIGTNANKLIPTYAYTPFTMRGGSELSGQGDGPGEGKGLAKGLDMDYATAWSYGIEETPNLMIPNFNGGSSHGSLDSGSETYRLFKSAGQNAGQICRSLPLYWGPQPFTAGPMYMGAISCFLFILGLCLLRNKEKWWLLACAVLALMLGWGRHMMWFTELWFSYVPMYNKFRTVSMALVILQFCMPLLGIYTLDMIMKQEIERSRIVYGTWISFALTGGFCLLCALVLSVAGDFVSASDAQLQPVVAEALQSDRRHLMQADAWRSFMLILASAALILWSQLKTGEGKKGKRMTAAFAIIGVLVFADMWTAGKRYLNSGHFISPKTFNAGFDKMRPVDLFILEDKDPSYRVLDLSESTFNSSLTSFRHKSIGGYSPAKMQRYQDLIDRYIAPEINDIYRSASQAGTLEEMQDALGYEPVLSMLNCRYIIVGADYPALYNPYAFGEAWFADGVYAVDNADDEIAALAEVDLHDTAVVRGDMIDPCPASRFSTENACVSMTSYAPNELHYSFSTQDAALCVFSEIYHPSWKAEIHAGGTVRPLELFRADWVLRAAVLPQGEGEIVMRYEPEDYARGEAVSLACNILLLLSLMLSAAWAIYVHMKKK